jgi:diguanylate cyclase (GGDEF)-like protein
VASECISENFRPLGSKTVRTDAGWLRKAGLDKKLATLFVLRGADTGLRIPLTKPQVTIGRTLDADLVFQDDRISRRHASISHDPETNTYTLVDLDSTNGTYVNDQPVRKTVLEDGNKIFIGGTILKFMLQDEVEMESGELVDRLLFQDDLTGLVVKRRFYKDLELRLLAASAQDTILSVLMMDMDGLKQVNDTYGHPVGAFVIAEAGKLIGKACNHRGQACRYGGDEFIAYLLNAPKEAAVDMGKRVCSLIRGHVFVKDGISLRLSISVGVATFPQDGKTIDVLVRAADEALYRAKGKGRDGVSE